MNRQQQQNKTLQKEANRILVSFCTNPNVRHRATIKVTKILLLNGPYAMQGVYRDIRSKSLGAGVCELYTAEVVE